MGKRAKICPKCKHQVYSSTRGCVCRSESENKYKMLSKQSSAKHLAQSKRSEKNKTKSKPADLKFEKPSKKKMTKTQNSQPVSNRMQLTCQNKIKLEVEQKKEEELEEIVLSKETIEKFAVILEDINKKICTASWKA